MNALLSKRKGPSTGGILFLRLLRGKWKDMDVFGGDWVDWSPRTKGQGQIVSESFSSQKFKFIVNSNPFLFPPCYPSELVLS